jgi:hypothetical protein
MAAREVQLSNRSVAIVGRATRADVAELVDAHGSGPCGGNPVEVRVLSSALDKEPATKRFLSYPRDVRGAFAEGGPFGGPISWSVLGAMSPGPLEPGDVDDALVHAVGIPGQVQLLAAGDQRRLGLGGRRAAMGRQVTAPPRRRRAGRRSSCRSRAPAGRSGRRADAFPRRRVVDRRAEVEKNAKASSGSPLQVAGPRPPG